MATLRSSKTQLVLVQLLLEFSLAGCGGSDSGGSNSSGSNSGGPTGVYVPKHPDQPYVFIQRLDFQPGGKVAINELGHHAVGEVVPTEEGFVRIIMQQGAGLKLRLTGEGCLLAEGDPRMVAEALKDGIDLNELNHLCPE